jgi:hypothetical protein
MSYRDLIKKIDDTLVILTIGLAGVTFWLMALLWGRLA